MAFVLRSATCLAYEPRLSWVRSFWDDERKESHCVYWATEPAWLIRHARNSRIPCDEVTKVGENHPSQWAHIYDDFGLPRHWESSDSAAVRWS
ncbi:MAG: nickel-binding protein [Dehalococcoidia bacterium]